MLNCSLTYSTFFQRWFYLVQHLDIISNLRQSWNNFDEFAGTKTNPIHFFLKTLKNFCNQLLLVTCFFCIEKFIISKITWNTKSASKCVTPARKNPWKKKNTLTLNTENVCSEKWLCNILRDLLDIFFFLSSLCIF